MKLAWIVAAEALGNLRDRRASLTTFVYTPLLGPLFFVLVISIAVRESHSSASEKLKIPIIGAEYATNLVAFLDQHGIAVAVDGPRTYGDLERAVQDGDAELGLVLAENTNEAFRRGQPIRVRMIVDRSRSKAMSRARRTTSVLEDYGAILTQQRLMARGVESRVVQPLVVDKIDVSTPTGRSLLVLGMVTYMLLLSTVLGGMYHAIDATGGERERGSLEPLLSLAIPRATIVLGKVLTTTLFMVVSIVLTLGVFAVATPWMPLAELGMSADFDGGLLVGAAFALVPFALLASVVMNAISAFSKTTKEAQSYIGFAMLGLTLPVAVAQVIGVDAEPALMVVPSLSQHVLITELLKGNAVPWTGYALAWMSSLTLSGLLFWVLVRRYRSEGILL